MKFNKTLYDTLYLKYIRIKLLTILTSLVHWTARDCA